MFSPEGNFPHMIRQHINTPYGIAILKSKISFVYLVLITLESKYFVHNYCYFAFLFSSMTKCQTLHQLVSGRNKLTEIELVRCHSESCRVVGRCRPYRFCAPCILIPVLTIKLYTLPPDSYTKLVLISLS